MTHEELVRKIQAKANAEMQDAIRLLRQEIAAALVKFGVYGVPVRAVSDRFSDTALTVMKVLISDDPRKGWPIECWRKREARLMDEVLATMDTLQQVLLAKEPAQIEGQPEEGAP